MDPVTLSLTAISVGLSAFGMFEKYSGEKAQEATQEKMIKTEQQQNDLRQRMMNLAASRERMELLRNAQRARSLALAGAARSGAQFGSGLQGGFGQISGATNVQGEKITQDTEAGNLMFGLQNTLSQEKIEYAKEGGTVNLGQGLMDIGQSIGKNSSQLTDLSKFFYGKLTNG